jgi:hypothetical protein
MSIFGSRDDDPLLQDDPLAPSSDNEESRDDAARPSSGGGAAGREQGPPHEAGTGVFGPFDAEASVPSDDPTREVVRTATQAAEGNLAPLNAALDQGWRVARVHVRGSAAGPSSREVVFVLRSTG